MKVFISWSGKLSHRVALAIRDWLPNVYQIVVPYVSSEDIDKGKRWNEEISRELEDSSFGIICVTRENSNAPWVHFEAGALSKIVGDAYVCPLLIGLGKAEIPNGPLVHFQATDFEKNDFKKLLQTMHKSTKDGSIGLDSVMNNFDKWWGDLEDKVGKITDEFKGATKKSKPEEYDKETINKTIMEILELSRETRREVHGNVTHFAGPDIDALTYEIRMLKNHIIHESIEHDRVRELKRELIHMQEILENMPDDQVEGGIAGDLARLQRAVARSRKILLEISTKAESNHGKYRHEVRSLRQ
jgi:hypothetical protein